jgi:glycosyltransferase involved in cell wall biosynthesis
VLLLTATLGNGGLERQLSLLATHLPPRWRPVVWSADDGPFAGVLRDAGVPVVIDRRRRRHDLSPLVRLAGLILARRPDVVHAWHVMPEAVAAPLCRLTGIPLVDGTIRLGRPAPGRDRPRRSLMALADVVVANSQAGLDAWGVRRPKGRVVYNAFDPARLELTHAAGRPEEPAADDAREPDASAGRPFTVVMTGRLHVHKDFGTLLAAARLLAASAPAGAWRFLLVGDGKEGGTLRAEAEDLVRAGVVDFVAPGLEVLPLVASADAGVLLTNDAVHAEGCSNSIMEYMACGLPVVANDSGGNRELVEDGVTGYLVASGDAPGVAGRLEELRVSARRSAMGAAGRERLLRDFTLTTMVDQYARIYDELAGRPA